MRIIEPSVEILTPLEPELLVNIERAGRTCYTEQTEILTEEGWKNIKDVGELKVLTYSLKDKTLQYQHSNMLSYNYEGEIYTSNHTNIAFEVTPDHRMLYSFPKREPYKLLEANELFSRDFPVRIPKWFEKVSRESPELQKDFEEKMLVKRGFLNSQEKSFKVSLSDDLLIILAAYITEGYIKKVKGTGASIGITQREDSEFYSIILESLYNLGWTYHVSTDPRKPEVKTFVIAGGLPFVKWIEKTCGRLSRGKYLPSWFRQLSNRQLKMFLDMLYLGDGSHNTTRTQKYMSVSDRLLNEVQEAHILLGKNASKGIMNHSSWKNPCGYVEESQRDSWILYPKQIEKKNYSGKVYCPSTQAGIVCIRLNGKSIWCGNCYKSEHEFTHATADKFVRMLISRGHESVLEHSSVTVKFIVDRGVSHEIVRHRIAAYSQESTRYCNYSKDKFGNEVTFIKPFFFNRCESLNTTEWGWIDHCDECSKYYFWQDVCGDAEIDYLELIKLGAKPEQARSVLPNSLKTEIVCTFNLREWRHFFKMRTSEFAHPQMREIVLPLYYEFKEKIPALVDDIEITDKALDGIPFAEVTYNLWNKSISYDLMYGNPELFEVTDWIKD